MEQVFLDKLHCPNCQGPLYKRFPKEDRHLVVNKETTVRYWCPCGYYRDEIEGDDEDVATA